WLGHAPFCGSHSCREGQTEILRKHGSGDSKIALFGGGCGTGEKTLCCSTEIVKSDPKTRCDQNTMDGGQC
ncbi:hypothetical protein PMAYCL1PPCAC_21692, partial [Pristionchus mayeri]